MKRRRMNDPCAPMFDAVPDLPDNTPIDQVRFSTRIRNAVTAAGLKTVAEIREASDATLLGFPDLGKGSVAHLRESLGLPSCDGVRPRPGQSNPSMFEPAPNLPDDSLIEMVRFSPLIRKSLNAAGLKTIGEIRAMSDDKLRRLRGVGTGSLAHMRNTIGTRLKAKEK